MKRSELILKMQESMVEAPLDIDEAAEYILKRLEREGVILPPARWRPHDWHERGITYSQWLQEPSKINEWESE